MALPPMRHDGQQELRKARGQAWRLYGAVGIFSFAVNMLMLTGPLFMMQVYDRVLASRSVETLTALFLLVVFLFDVPAFFAQVVGQRVGQRSRGRRRPPLGAGPGARG